MIVQKGLVFDIRRFTVHDGPGIRTTVFFKGCPLSCWWCHNPESQAFRSEVSNRNLLIQGVKFTRTETTGKLMTAGEVIDEVLKDRIFYDESNGGVTFSGGEPLMQDQFLRELLILSHDHGIHTTIDTSGYAGEDIFNNIAELADLFLFDLKIMDNGLHEKVTGVSNKLILQNLKNLSRRKRPFIIRFPVIPGFTDTADNIKSIKKFLGSLPDEKNGMNPGLDVPDRTYKTVNQPIEVHLLPYHALACEKYRRFRVKNKLAGIPSIERESLSVIKQEFEAAGFLTRIGGG